MEAYVNVLDHDSMRLWQGALRNLSALNEDARELFVEHGGVAILLDIAVKGAASGDGDEAHVEEGEDASLATFEPLEAQRMAMEGVSVLCLTAKAENKAREQLLEEESLEAIRTLSKTEAERKAREQLLEDEFLEAIRTLAKTEDHLVAYGLVSGLFNATRETKVVEGEEQEMLHRLKVATDNASRPKDVDEEMEAVYQERREREALTAEFRKGLVDAGIARELLCLTQVVLALDPQL
ncbi:hypothetical protein T484DRAFT_1815615 [Baffinella frigidus]|nr:hypothetical protein T484DRAFT_1815615 [Cryptophyta sp. CCMP2293]